MKDPKGNLIYLSKLPNRTYHSTDCRSQSSVHHCTFELSQLSAQYSFPSIQYILLNTVLDDHFRARTINNPNFFDQIILTNRTVAKIKLNRLNWKNQRKKVWSSRIDGFHWQLWSEQRAVSVVDGRGGHPVLNGVPVAVEDRRDGSHDIDSTPVTSCPLTGVHPTLWLCFRLASSASFACAVFLFRPTAASPRCPHSRWTPDRVEAGAWTQRSTASLRFRRYRWQQLPERGNWNSARRRPSGFSVCSSILVVLCLIRNWSNWGWKSWELWEAWVVGSKYLLNFIVWTRGSIEMRTRWEGIAVAGGRWDLLMIWRIWIYRCMGATIGVAKHVRKWRLIFAGWYWQMVQACFLSL